MWLKYEKASDINWQSILSNKTAWNNAYGFHIGLYDNNDTRIQIRGGNANPVYEPSPVISSWIGMPWTHTVFSFNGSSVTGFFNGVESFSGTIAPASNSSYPLGVGNNAVGSTDTWDGPIDELRIDKYASL